MAINYPLTATFKLLALSPEVTVRDSSGALMLQVKQKGFTLREETTVFADEAKKVPLYKMMADRVIGFRAVHKITRLADNALVGAVKAAGLRSLWRTHYDIADSNDQVILTVREENPWIKVLDALVDEIPLVGFIISMFINPRYLMTDSSGTVLYRITKKRSILESHFTLEQMTSQAAMGNDERLIALALIQVIFLEKHRG
ncbi:MAG: hypothetical protein RLZZ156_208 [Deinococcota bacterium]|jgi:uncharacterized protein YxjI